ncbi:hypothetical protein BIY26_22410 [Brenneria goodwinii]|uniref:Uncharacterized protein n=1 Tax=Brenneria goodwinii TaxID=1109412 RepID=A0A0G4JUX1_9GAMM|nr:hypothetical protein [Brenneria goodwinii]ATA26471.1 hypothetical protein AWC36_21505 [Brenneria goodwinii]RLM16365.1 hypothetical protein BIY26_22410 [Brenneria goodwinii]RLM18517.1 hypothetical protein BIY28_18210 [Brenneria goodwinii]CPR16645.1 hypothetical protein BN1221_02194 [Brenneria goodwinii]
MALTDAVARQARTTGKAYTLKPASRSWWAISVSDRFLSACVVWLPSRLHRQNWFSVHVRSSIISLLFVAFWLQ